MTAPDADAVLLNVWPEAGRRLRLGRTKTWELVRSGDLKTVQLGRRRLVPVTALNEFAEQLRAAP